MIQMCFPTGFYRIILILIESGVHLCHLGYVYVMIYEEYLKFGFKSMDKVHMGHVCVQVSVHV